MNKLFVVMKDGHLHQYFNAFVYLVEGIMQKVIFVKNKYDKYQFNDNLFK